MQDGAGSRIQTSTGTTCLSVVCHFRSLLVRLSTPRACVLVTVCMVRSSARFEAKRLSFEYPTSLFVISESDGVW